MNNGNCLLTIDLSLSNIFKTSDRTIVCCKMRVAIKHWEMITSLYKLSLHLKKEIG